MGLLSRIIGGAAPVAARVEPSLGSAAVASAQAPTSGVPLSQIMDIGWGGAARSRRTPPSTARQAERHGTVFACCNIIAGDLAKVPLKLYQRGAAGAPDSRVHEHPATFLINVEPVEGLSAFDLRYALAYSYCLRGVSYAHAPRDGRGDLTLIEPLFTDSVGVRRSGRSRVYDFEDGAGTYRQAMNRSMIHLRYGAQDGWSHRSPIEVAADSLGLALAGQTAALRTAEGGTTKAVIKLRDDYAAEDERDVQARRIGAALRGDGDAGFPVLNEGEDVKTLDLSATDMELLSSRKFDREMIMGAYRMPSIKLQIVDGAVKATGQQQSIDYLTDCLMHYGRAMEGGYQLGLLTRAEREAGLFFRHDFSALMQPTTAELYEALKVGVGGPFVTPNQAQRMARLPLTTGGDTLYPPANMTREDQPDTGKENDGA